MMSLLLKVVGIAAGCEGVFCGKNAKNASGDFVMNDCFVVFANDVYAEFLREL